MIIEHDNVIDVDAAGAAASAAIRVFTAAKIVVTLEAAAEPFSVLISSSPVLSFAFFNSISSFSNLF